MSTPSCIFTFHIDSSCRRLNSFRCTAIMSMDQCALNPNGSLKDPKDIQWFFDKDDARPLPSDPSTATPAQPLGRGHRNKAANRFLDAVARERLGSDEPEDPIAPARPPGHKHAAGASNISDGAASTTLPPRNSLETLLEGSSAVEKDGSFQPNSGSESEDDSGGDTELEYISNNEVRVVLLQSRVLI